MMTHLRIGYLFFILALPQWATAQEADLVAPLAPDRSVVWVYYPDPQALQELTSERGVWNVDLEAGYVVLDLDADEMMRLQDRGFFLEIDWEATALHHQVRTRLPGQGSGIPGFPCYLTVDETFAQAQEWLATYPDLVDWVDIGDSWEKTQDTESGFDLNVLVLSNKRVAGPKPAIFIMSSVHAREYAPAGINARLAQFLLENYAGNADVHYLLDYHEVHLLLQANPDGRIHAQHGNFWRKNTNNAYCSNSDLRGADLNRNFEFEWACCGGASNDPCSEVYRGPSGGSEPEIQAIQDYVRNLFPDQREDDLSLPAPADATGIFVDVHSSGGLVMWPYGITTDLVPNHEGHRALGRKQAFFNDYTAIPISSFTIADGSTVDFAYGELGVASFAYEVGSTFFENCQSFEGQVLPDNLAALFYLARHARNPYLSAGGPDVIDLAINESPSPSLWQITARLDDTRYLGAEPTQTLTSCEYFVDNPPWLPGALAIPMAAADGNFNNNVENVTASLDVTGLAVGRHSLFVRGSDASGATGIVSAVFFQVEENLTYEQMLALWPQGITILDLLQAL